MPHLTIAKAQSEYDKHAANLFAHQVAAHHTCMNVWCSECYMLTNYVHTASYLLSQDELQPEGK